MPGKESKKSTATNIAEKIQLYIQENELGPGSMLPSIDRLSGIFDVSKSTVREALQQLVSAGMVSIQQGRGTYVTDCTISNLLETQSWLTFCNNITPEEVTETRVAVEGMMVQLAANRISLTEIRELHHLLSEMENCFTRDDYERFLVLAEQFYQCIGKSSRNRFLAELSAGLRKLPVFDVEDRDLRNLSIQVLGHFRGIHTALAAHDADTANELIIEYVKGLQHPEPQKDVVIYYDILGTGSLGGSFYTLGQAIARLIHAHTHISLDINVTGGGIENVRLAQDRRIAIGITQADVAHSAFYGLGNFDFPHSNLRVIGCLPGLELQISTLASSGIQSLSELRGKTLAVGAHGGASVNVARLVLEHSGLEWAKDYDPKIVPFAAAVDMLRNGFVDAVFYLSIGQSPALLDLALEQKIRLIDLSHHLINSLESSNPYWYKTTIETNTYPSQNRPVHTIGIPAILVTHRDLPESDAYSMASSVFMHTNEIQSLVWPPRLFTLNDAARKVGVPYHSGAIRFFADYRITVE